tara:strand:+ start:1021 stop:1296 length:276 start_codon:yes stop_codon:yes gene_type:complete
VKVMARPYRISRKYVFLDKEPVLLYYIEDVPFAFDSLEREEKQEKWVLIECAMNPEYTLQDILRAGDYLQLEECHPVFFELDLYNPEVLPT